MVQGDDVPAVVHQDELVKGVGDIAGRGVRHAGEGVGDGHVPLPDGEGQVGLVVQAVTAGVHLMGRADIEVAVVLVAAQAARVKGNIGVGPPQAGLSQAVPILVILHYPDDLGAVALAGVLLAEDQEVVVLPGEEAAPQRQLRLQGNGILKLEGGVVGLHHDLLRTGHCGLAGVDVVDLLTGVILHPHQVLSVLVQIGADRDSPVAVVGAALVPGLRRGGRPGGQGGAGEQGQGQRPGTYQGQQPVPKVFVLHKNSSLFDLRRAVPPACFAGRRLLRGPFIQ